MKIKRLNSIGIAVGLCLNGLAWADDCQTPLPVVTQAMEQPANTVRVEGQRFVDRQGRDLILRAVNVSGDAKLPPFRGVIGAGQLDPLPEWGFNAVRLLFTWEAFEPTPCEYDRDYLSYYQQVVEWAEERDLLVIVDFHQDAFSRFTNRGCGEGFPAWAVHSSIPLREPRNDHRCESWGTWMIFDKAQHQAWHHFHRDSEGARTRYIAMMERVAHHLSRHGNVIGYEIINEPWGSDAELVSLYEDAGAALRRQHSDAILFVPPHALLSSGLLVNGMPRPGLTNFAYSPHFYDPLMFSFKRWFGNSSAVFLNPMRQFAERWNVPMFLGELGATAGLPGVVGYTRQLYDWLDKHGVSSAHWNYTPNWTQHSKDGWNHENLSISNDRGQLRDNYFVRPYPVVTAGKVLSFRTDETGFEFVWQVVTDTLGVDAENELFVPPEWWQRGFSLQSSVHAPLTCEQRVFRLVCNFPETFQSSAQASGQDSVSASLTLTLNPMD